jgi:hypothetical protein
MVNSAVAVSIEMESAPDETRMAEEGAAGCGAVSATGFLEQPPIHASITASAIMQRTDRDAM